MYSLIKSTTTSVRLKIPHLKNNISGFDVMIRPQSDDERFKGRRRTRSASSSSHEKANDAFFVTEFWSSCILNAPKLQFHFPFHVPFLLKMCYVRTVFVPPSIFHLFDRQMNNVPNSGAKYSEFWLSHIWSSVLVPLLTSFTFIQHHELSAEKELFCRLSEWN